MVRTIVYSLEQLFQLRHFSFSIYSLVKRDIRARYAGSFLGMLWIVINPLIQLFIYSFVFSIVLRVRLGPQYAGVNYTSWLLAGLLPWMFFADAIGRAPSAVLEQQQLVKKTTFPSQYFTLVQLLSSLVQHIIALGIFGVYLEVIHPMKLHVLPLLIIPLLIQMLMMSGISWAVSSINVYVRDTQQIVLVVLNLLFYLTPIIYPSTALPARYVGLFLWNPLYFVINSYRTIILTGSMSASGLGPSLLFCFVFFLSGAFLFRRLKRGFADVL